MTVPTPVPWRLSPEDRLAAIAEGRRRQTVNEAVGARGRNGGPVATREAISAHLIGAAGEMAVADYLSLKAHLYADQYPVRGSFDLPPDIDVKTAHRHAHRLLCLPDARRDRRLVLVTVEQRQIVLRGWIQAADAMRAEWSQELVAGRRCYFVPQSALAGMDELKAALAVRIG